MDYVGIIQSNSEGCANCRAIKRGRQSCHLRKGRSEATTGTTRDLQGQHQCRSWGVTDGTKGMNAIVGTGQSWLRAHMRHDQDSGKEPERAYELSLQTLLRVAR